DHVDKASEVQKIHLDRPYPQPVGSSAVQPLGQQTQGRGVGPVFLLEQEGDSGALVRRYRHDLPEPVCPIPQPVEVAVLEQVTVCLVKGDLSGYPLLLLPGQVPQITLIAQKAQSGYMEAAVQRRTAEYLMVGAVADMGAHH